MSDSKYISGLIPLKQVIFSYIDESMQDRSNYRRLYPIAMRGVVDLGQDVFFEPYEVKLQVASNMTVKLPSDTFKVISVGILGASGDYVPLNFSTQMTTYGDTSPSRLSENNDSTDISTWNTNLYYNEFFYNLYPYSTLYGVPSGLTDVGCYKVDMNNGVIILDNNFTYSYIILKYLSFDSMQEILIPTNCLEALIAWIAWKDISTKPVTNKYFFAEKTNRRRQYFSEKMNASLRNNDFSLERANEVYRAGVRLTVKA